VLGTRHDRLARVHRRGGRRSSRRILYAGFRPSRGKAPRSLLVELLGAPSPIDLLGEPSGTKTSSKSATVRDYGRHWTPVHLDFAVSDLDAPSSARFAPARRSIGTSRRAVRAHGEHGRPFGNGFCLLEFRGRGYDELVAPTNRGNPTRQAADVFGARIEDQAARSVGRPSPQRAPRPPTTSESSLARAGAARSANSRSRRCVRPPSSRENR